MCEKMYEKITTGEAICKGPLRAHPGDPKTFQNTILIEIYIEIHLKT